MLVLVYSFVASSMGRQFEQQWLTTPSNPRDGALQMPDFSATIDLYSIVANVQQTKTVPIGMRSIGRLAARRLLNTSCSGRVALRSHRQGSA